MSHRGRLARAGAVFTLSLFGAFALWACGGGFYLDWILGDDSLVSEAPPAWFGQEIRRLTPRGKPAHTAVVGQDGPYNQTAAVEAADLEAALQASDLPADRRARLLAEYKQERDKVLSYASEMDDWRQEGRWRDTQPPRPEPPELTVPEGFPGEIEDYARGAAAYYLGRPEEARAAWGKLLDRPAAERRRRSTWAAFMLGRMAVESDPESAVRWFDKIRGLAAGGFPDPLGLAAASLGWQARAEMGRRRFGEALELYLEQYRSGDARALQSFRRVAARVFKDPEGLRQTALSPRGRDIVTAWVLAGWPNLDLEEVDGLEEVGNPEAARTWLAAIDSAGVRELDGAERLAWLAYRIGDFAAAASWLERARADEPMALWVRAKLLLREGKLAEAEALLEKAAATLPASPDYDDDYAWTDGGPPPAGRDRALRELGALRLAQSEYVPALEAMTRTDAWPDAAWVAERVLTLGELRTYVKSWERRPHGSPTFEENRQRLRDLLARRLARAGRYQEASAYFTDERKQKAMTGLTAALGAGRDARRPAAQRAESLFEAACRTRHQGLEILGTELDPDWALGGGSLEGGTAIESRQDAAQHPFLPASAGELARARRSAPRYTATFHYRYRGADLVWEAASLLPDETDEKARMLAVAGSWLKYLNPEAADRFYKRLVRCCGNTELGRTADERRWFPTVDDCATIP
ncbi:MAG TPA: hypothetical protein VKK31_01455 [Thermoanaerobaculia bacterium]|nr:hypothetical protein [Thermoanaerobaculia bacterium]